MSKYVTVQDDRQKNPGADYQYGADTEVYGIASGCKLRDFLNEGFHESFESRME